VLSPSTDAQDKLYDEVAKSKHLKTAGPSTLMLTQRRSGRTVGV